MLKKAHFIHEILHPTWFSNPIMVLKSSGKMRICVDFTDVNKACANDPYPLPRID